MIVDARLMGADAVLLIVAALSDDELTRFHGLATDLGLAVLVEVHDAHEADRALAAGADIIGVNQRNLHSFEIDYDLAEQLLPRLPSSAVRVAESGIRDAADAARLSDAGYDAILVGTSVVTADGPGSAVGALVDAGRRS